MRNPYLRSEAVLPDQPNQSRVSGECAMRKPTENLKKHLFQACSKECTIVQRKTGSSETQISIWTDSTKNFHLTAQNRIDISTPSYNQVTSPLYLKSISRWKNYEKHFKETKKYLDKWVNEFDYKI